MQTTKKTLLVLISILFVLSGVYGAVYFLKKYNTSTHYQDKDSIPESPYVISGFQRDMESSISENFLPKGLVTDDDVATVIESFSIDGIDGGSTQYTFRYISTKDFFNNKNNYFRKISQDFTIINISNDDLKQFFSIHGRNQNGSEISVLLNKTSLGVSVDVTYIIQ